MIKKFKEFINIFEGLQPKKSGGYKLDFSGDSKKDVMSLQFLNKKRRIQEINGVKYSYYFAYTHKNSNDRDVLQYLKKMEGEPLEMDAFIKKAVQGLDKAIDLSTVDAIVYPKSSSKLLSAVANFAIKKAGNALMIPDAFVKSMKYEMVLDREALAKAGDNTIKQVEAVFNKIQNSPDEFKMKTVYAPFRKFIKKFIKFDRKDSESTNKILGGKIVLIDDYRTTGTTLKEMVEQLIHLQPNEIIVMVIVDVK